MPPLIPSFQLRPCLLFQKLKRCIHANMRQANKCLRRGVNLVGQTFLPCSALFSFTQNLKENSLAEMLSFFCSWNFSLDSLVVGYIVEI